jgi:hypothetical protein
VWCGSCGFEHYSYHSCRNRHCPKCQTLAKAAWVEARQSELLPVPYFHNVFTLPHELNRLVLCSERNQRALLRLLFDAAAGTLLDFWRRELSGQVGFTLVLHTWDQQLRAHYHVHGLIASGALVDGGASWRAGGGRFLFPVCGLSKVFRAKYLDGLTKLLEQGDLDVPPQLVEGLGATEPRRRYLAGLRRQPWVVYSKAPFAGPRKLLDYLGRYTHRVALSNDRLLSCADGQVCFTWRDRRDEDRLKAAALPADEFIRRFLQHVMPRGFVRIRHYGLLANRGKRQRLTRCRQLMGAPQSRAVERPRPAVDWLRAVLGIDLARCPCCGDGLQREALRPPALPLAMPVNWSAPSQIKPWNTS